MWVDPGGGLLVALDGELYASEKAVSASGDTLGLSAPGAPCAELVGALYRRHGENWVQRVRGAFAVCILDVGAGALWLFNDRFGLRPLNYTQATGDLIVSSSLAALTASFPEHPWRLDPEAAASWFAFDHVLGSSTPLAEVSVLPNAGRLRYDLHSGAVRLDNYWSMESIPDNGNITFEEAVEEGCRLFGQAVAEQTSGDVRCGIYLTSGLDSRTSAGVMWKRGTPFRSFTYGHTGCRDMVWGADLARLMGSEHFPQPLDDGRWICEHGEEYIAASDGFANLYKTCQGIRDYSVVGESIDVHISGYGGGSFAGGDTTTVSALTLPTLEGQVEELYKSYTLNMGYTFRSPMERYHLFEDGFWRKAGMGAEHAMHAEAEKYRRLRRDIVGDAFCLNNRYKKMFAYMIGVERDYFEDRSPFMDYAFMDFLFSIPTQHRLHRKLQLGMLDCSLPELTCVPWQCTCCPPTLDKRRVDEHYARVKDTALPTEPGRNFARFLVDDGLDWVGGILDSDTLQRRGVLNRRYLRDILGQAGNMGHMVYPDQRNIAFRLGAATTFELMCRSLVDNRAQGLCIPPQGG